MIFFQTCGHSVVDFFSARKQGVGQDGVQPQGLEADASADRRRRRQGTNAIKLFFYFKRKFRDRSYKTLLFPYSGWKPTNQTSVF